MIKESTTYFLNQRQALGGSGTRVGSEPSRDSPAEFPSAAALKTGKPMVLVTTTYDCEGGPSTSVPEDEAAEPH